MIISNDLENHWHSSHPYLRSMCNLYPKGKSIFFKGVSLGYRSHSHLQKSNKKWTPCERGRENFCSAYFVCFTVFFKWFSLLILFLREGEIENRKLVIAMKRAVLGKVIWSKYSVWKQRKSLTFLTK